MAVSRLPGARNEFRYGVMNCHLAWKCRSAAIHVLVWEQAVVHLVLPP